MALSNEQIKRLRRMPVRPGKNRIKVARELAQLTQVDLAQHLGLTQSSLSDIERRRFGGTTIDTAQKFVAFFGCAFEDLFPSSKAMAS